jgi:hypothetical protein
VSWELRGNRRYYTRSRRIKGKLTRSYIGKGLEAEIAAAIDAANRAQRKVKSDAHRALFAHIEMLDSLTREMEESVRVLVEAVLLVAGYHRHDRGKWQKRRNDERTQ